MLDEILLDGRDINSALRFPGIARQIVVVGLAGFLQLPGGDHVPAFVVVPASWRSLWIRSAGSLTCMPIVAKGYRMARLDLWVGCAEH